MPPRPGRGRGRRGTNPTASQQSPQRNNSDPDHETIAYLSELMTVIVGLCIKIDKGSSTMEIRENDSDNIFNNLPKGLEGFENDDDENTQGLIDNLLFDLK